MPHEPELLVLDAHGADPDAEIRALHSRGPAARVDLLGVTAWAVSEPAPLKELLTSPDVSKDARQHWPRFEEVSGTWQLALWVTVKNMFTAYGSEHRRLRRLVAPAFAPRRVAALAGSIEAVVTGLLDDLAATAPGEVAHVRAGRAGWADVVEETLRLKPAIKHLPLRFAVRDIPLPDGQVISAGEAILASYAAANRHPGRLGDGAGTFDLTRTAPEPEHLAFGHGVHYCLGAPLARLEAVTALRALFARFRDAELAVPEEKLEPMPSLITYGHKHLPVRLRPAV